MKDRDRRVGDGFSSEQTQVGLVEGEEEYIVCWS